MPKTETKPTPVERYMLTFAGRELLKKYKLSEEGTWRIRGEDPNCDWGGHHYQPELGIVEGTLKDVIEYAVTIPSFWTWGAGGHFEKMDPPVKVTPGLTAKRVELQRKIEKLEKELKEARIELGEL